MWYLKEGSWNHFKVPERKVKIKIYIDFISTKSFLKITSNMFLLARREWFCLSTRYTAIIEGFFVCWNILLSHPDLHIFWATSKTWTRTLKNLDPEKPGPWQTWTLETLNPKKHGITIELKCLSEFRELCFIKTMRNVIYCLIVRVLTDI